MRSMLHFQLSGAIGSNTTPTFESFLQWRRNFRILWPYPVSFSWNSINAEVNKNNIIMQHTCRIRETGPGVRSYQVRRYTPKHRDAASTLRRYIFCHRTAILYADTGPSCPYRSDWTPTVATLKHVDAPRHGPPPPSCIDNTQSFSRLVGKHHSSIESPQWSLESQGRLSTTRGNFPSLAWTKAASKYLLYG